MDIFKVLTMLGGLALFLFGMQVMGEGLEKRAGNQLKGILEKMTSNPIKGVLLGIAVTAVIQSSSATTVMIVGFVNSGIMQLSQAIGVIMGANVGTTVTSWILSLSGIQGDNFFVNMLKPSSFSPILAIIGVGMLLFSKSSKKKDTASIMLGFAVLMFGMQTMTDAVQPLASIPEFANLLLVFENPLMAVLAGAVLTAVIQSSSASVGILQAIAATGSLTYGAAIPIIMGQNIGTCITAILSSIGTNRNAKRTAVVHLLFNIIGTCICLALFYTLNAIVEFAFIGDSINALGIAIVHSTFNVICTALLLPFTKQLEKLVCLIIKDDKKTEEFQMLDDRLLATPSIAVEQCKKLSSEMANLARDGLVRSVSACLDYDATQAKIIAQEEDAVDMFEDKLGSYLVKLSQKTMSNSDSREISKILHTIGDLERISDRSVNISKATYELFEKKLSFTDSAKEELTVICDSLIEIVNLAVHAYVANDLESARQVEPLEQVVDFLKGQLKARHIERLQRGECTIEMGFIFSDLITNFERIADHCSNIAVCTIQLNENTFDTHEYLNTLKNSNNADFMNMYKGFKEKYQLPA